MSCKKPIQALRGLDSGFARLHKVKNKQQRQELLVELKSCSMYQDLKSGRYIHAKILEGQKELDTYVVNTLINMYRTCGSMLEAHAAFDNITEPDIVHWNTLLLGYAGNGQGHTALDLFYQMKASGSPPDNVTYIAALKACISVAMNGNKLESLELGKHIHLEIDCHMNKPLQNTLLEMYSRCGSMFEARRIFDSIKQPDVINWNTLLFGYLENGGAGVALDLFAKMKASGFFPVSVTYIAALKACTALYVNGNASKFDCLKLGKELHSEIGCELNVVLRNTLIDMYFKCGGIDLAVKVFECIKEPSVVSWNSMIQGYVDNGEGYLALDILAKMKAAGYSPNSVTYTAALKSCTTFAVKKEGLERGRKIHSEIDCHWNPSLYNALIDMYSKCGSMVDARRIFDSIKEPDVVHWNTLLLGYAENGEGVHTLHLFARMKERECVLNSGTYAAVLKACTYLSLDEEPSGNLNYLELGREIHSEIGCSLNHCLQNTLVEMYAKCGSMVDARSVFDSIENPNVVHWNTLLLGYAGNGEGHRVKELLFSMEFSKCFPDSVTYIAILKACGLTGDLAFGRKVHKEISEFTPQLVTCLVDFYVKCGCLVEARDAFELHYKSRNITTWNTILTGYGRFGDYKSVFKLFESMRNDNVRPDSITFVCLLLCCSYAGLVEKASECFDSMGEQYGLKPTVVHYTCVIDVLGRENHLGMALSLMQKMHGNRNVVTWTTLLSACHKWKNVEIGRLAFMALADMDHPNPSAFVLMADVYRWRGMWEEQERVLFRTWQLSGVG